MIVPKGGIVIIDVDGTIIDQNDKLRPYVIQFVLALKKDDITVYLWSAGGFDYTFGKARLWFIEDLFDGFLTKSISLQMGVDAETMLIDNETLVTSGKLIEVSTFDQALDPGDTVFQDLILQHRYDFG